MVLPGGLNRPENVKVEVEKYGEEGLYILKNAYVGDYEYFPGEVLIKDAGLPVSGNTGEALTKTKETFNTSTE